MKGIRIGKDKGLCPEVLKYVKQFSKDLIVVGQYSSPTYMIAIHYMKRKNIPFTLNTDGGFAKEDSPLKYRIKRYFISSAAQWLTTGKLATEYFVHYGADPERTHIYPFTSLKEENLLQAEENAKLGKAALRSALGITEKNMILSVGRFSYQNGYGKGYDTLMRMAKQIPQDTGIYIVGDEPTEEFVAWKNNEKIENIHFVGFKQKDELGKYYAAADIFVLMTIADVWGLVINEAMAYGLPVISSDMCLAGRELIEEGGNGYIIPVGDDHMLAQKCMQLLESPQQLSEFGQASKQKISGYTIEKMAEKHAEILG